MGMWNERLRLRDSLRVERGLGARVSRETRRKATNYSPVQHAEELHDPLLTSGRADRRNLDGKAVHASVVSQDR